MLSGGAKAKCPRCNKLHSVINANDIENGRFFVKAGFVRCEGVAYLVGLTKEDIDQQNLYEEKM